MARPKKSTYLSRDELRWFSLNRYEGLKTATPAQWAQFIYDRANLALLQSNAVRDASLRSRLVELFERVKQAPLAPLGFSQVWQRSHARDTDHVRLLSWNTLEGLSAYAESNESIRNREASVDAQLLNVEPLLAQRYAHLTIDLGATDREIKEDFDHWLAGWRRVTETKVVRGDYTSTKLDDWWGGQYAPFFDLRFYARMQGGNIDKDTYRDLLRLSELEVPLKSQMDTLNRRVDQVISFTTWQAMH